MMAKPRAVRRENAILAATERPAGGSVQRMTLGGVIKVCGGMEADPNESLALVVCFVGAVLADRDSCPRSLASRMAPVHTVSPGWPLIRRDFCLATGDSFSACASSWVPR